MADYLNIAGRVRTTASDGVAMEAQEVKDLNLNKSQQEVNADVQTELGDRYTKEETYNREEIEGLVEPTNYVSVVATNLTTDVTDLLPAEGATDTIYRVGNWNGTQYDPTMYALFAWNGTTYVCLAVRSFVGEVYDISVNHPDGQGNPTPYADLAAALGTSGANIPADIRLGGMSIKFIQGTVQSSDNKYVQYRLMATLFSTTESDWQGVDDEPTAGSDNLAKSGGIYKSIQNVQNDLDLTKNGYPLNQIYDINTSNISYVPLKNDAGSSTGWPKVENVVDNESPFKDIIGYYTKITNLSSTNINAFKWEKAYHIADRTNKPSIISFSFWLNKNDIDDNDFTPQILSFSTKSTPSLAFLQDGINISRILYHNDIITKSVNKSGLLSANVKASAVYNVGDWYQINIIYDNIEWDFAEGSAWMFGMAFNYQQTKMTHPIRLVNPQIIFDSYVPAGVYVLPDIEDSITPYPTLTSLAELENNVDKNTIDIEIIKGKLGMGDNVLHYVSGNDVYSNITSPFDETRNLRTYFYVKRTPSFENNDCFCFGNVCLVNKSNGSESVVHYTGDDICPANYNGTYIGANHADSRCTVLTVPSHGKTAADIGSVWVDGSNNECVLVGVPDANTLWFFGPNVLQYPLFTFDYITPFTEGSILTHKTGATHTDSITIGSGISGRQFYSALRVTDTKIIVDGKSIETDGDYGFSKLDICQTYDVLNPASVIEKIKQRVGTFEETPLPSSITDADVVARHTIVYSFDSAGEWRIATNFIAIQPLNILYFGFTQQNALVGTNCKMYIPKALPVNNIDFRTVPAFNTLSSQLNITSEYWENPQLPPDRWVQMTDNIGVHSGYLFDYGVGGNNRKNMVNNAFYLYTSRKCYPYGISKDATNIPTPVPASSVYSAVTWRSYLNRSKMYSNGVIAENVFEYNGKCYLYGDYNQSGVYEIEIPDKYVGKTIEVFEKSNNLTILQELSSSKILVKVATASPMYAYIVASIK